MSPGNLVLAKVNIKNNSWLKLINNPDKNHLPLTAVNITLPVINLQAAILQLAFALQSNQALHLSTLIGQRVIAANNIMRLTQQKISSMFIEIPNELSEGTITIYSQSKKLIRTISMGKQPLGLVEFIWDGLNEQGKSMPGGTYIIEVNGLSAGGELSLKTMTVANVDSASIGKNRESIKLHLADLGELLFSLHQL